MTDAPTTQEDRILWTLQAAWPNWVPAPELARISLQYSARIFALRRKGWAISNRVEVVNGIRHGFFRLGSKPVPRSAEIRLRAERRAGELLAEMKEKGQRAAKEKNLRRGPKSSQVTSEPILSDLGITKNQSSKWQPSPVAPVGDLLFEIAPDRTYLE